VLKKRLRGSTYIGRKSKYPLDRRLIVEAIHQLRSYALSGEGSRYVEMINVPARLDISVSNKRSVMLDHERRNASHSINPKRRIY
jgi:hypothetical protein